MVRHPEVMKKAQAVIDSVVGRDHLPTLDDRPELPYIDCIVKEVFRCILNRNLHLCMIDSLFVGQTHRCRFVLYLLVLRPRIAYASMQVSCMHRYRRMYTRIGPSLRVP